MSCSVGYLFEITLENWLDRVSKEYRFAQEVQTGNVSFDEKYYLSSDSPQFLRTLFSEQTAQDLVQLIFNAGFQKIRCNGDKIEAFKYEVFKSVWEAMPEAGPVGDALIALEKLSCASAKEVPNIGPLVNISTAIAGVRNTLLFVLAGELIFFVIAHARFSPIDLTGAWTAMWRFQVPIGIFLYWALFCGLKGRSSAHWEFLVLALILSALLAVGGASLTVFINGAFDRSAEIGRGVPIIYKYVSRSKRATRYYACAPSWRSTEATICLPLAGRDTYDAIQIPGSELHIKTRSGALGFEWITEESFSQQYDQ